MLNSQLLKFFCNAFLNADDHFYGSSVDFPATFQDWNATDPLDLFQAPTLKSESNPKVQNVLLATSSFIFFSTLHLKEFSWFWMEKDFESFEDYVVSDNSRRITACICMPLKYDSYFWLLLESGVLSWISDFLLTKPKYIWKDQARVRKRWLI